MLRGLIKTGIATSLHRTGTDSVIGACSRRKHIPLVVGYHRVVENFEDSAARTIPPMLISAEMLARHLDWIGRRYEFVTLDDVAEWAEGIKVFNKPVAAVTFDEGYADVYEHGFPVLKEKGIPATVFALTGIVGTQRMPIHDELYLLLVSVFAEWESPAARLSGLLRELGIDRPLPSSEYGALGIPYRLMRLFLETLPQADLLRISEALRAEIEISEDLEREHRCMDWSMLCEMQRADMIVGSHTRTHALLTNEAPDKVLEEALDSREDAKERCGRDIKHFAYPDGRFDAATVNAVARAGYRSAYSICEHRYPAYPQLTIPRRIFWEKSCVDAWGKFSPAIMSCQVNGIFDGANRCALIHEDGIYRPTET